MMGGQQCSSVDLICHVHHRNQNADWELCVQNNQAHSNRFLKNIAGEQLLM